MRYRIERISIEEGEFDPYQEARFLRTIASDTEKLCWNFDEQQADPIHHDIGNIRNYLKLLAEKLENLVIKK